MGPQRTDDPGVEGAVGEDDVARGVRAGKPTILQHGPVAPGGHVEHGQALALVLGLVVRALVPEHVGAACAPGPRSARPCDAPVCRQRSHAETDTFKRTLHTVRMQRQAIAGGWGPPAEAGCPAGGVCAAGRTVGGEVRQLLRRALRAPLEEPGRARAGGTLQLGGVVATGGAARIVQHAHGLVHRLPR